MSAYNTVAERDAFEAEMPWEARHAPPNVLAMLRQTAAAHGARPAITFQLTSGPTDRAETLDWQALLARVTQAANLFRSLGVGEHDVVAYVLPNCTEAVVTLLGGATAGIVAAVNPLMKPAQMAAILRETRAKVVVTLRSFPKSEVAGTLAQALADAPGVETVLEVDLNRYLAPPKSWIVPFLRPKAVAHGRRTLDFGKACDGQPADRLTFKESDSDRVAAYFHTGGTTGMPKIAQHKASGMVYNGWLGATLLFGSEDVLICPLPLFHCFAAYPVLMSVVASGAHVVFPTPAGYRGEGVFDNFWKLVERWRVSFVITVPTAIAALMQRPVDADLSSLKTALSGSSPLPIDLYRRFEAATGVTLFEGYGLTECTCLVSINPPAGAKKIGSVGIPFAYTDVRILDCDAEGAITRECARGEVGEICVASPGVFEGSTYTEVSKNRGLFAGRRFLRTGDLGRLDEEGYLFITGRAKDLIIRGGHNIDPAIIEEALAGHPAVAFVGAIGQPDAHAGELPCAYVELVEGSTASSDELSAHAAARIGERAAIPKYIEIVEELPKTAVGKIFKPDLRKRAIARIYGAALTDAGIGARVAEVVDDPKRGLVARLRRTGEETAEPDAVLGIFTRPWEWAD